MSIDVAALRQLLAEDPGPTRKPTEQRPWALYVGAVGALPELLDVYERCTALDALPNATAVKPERPGADTFAHGWTAAMDCVRAVLNG